MLFSPFPSTYASMGYSLEWSTLYATNFVCARIADESSFPICPLMTSSMIFWRMLNLQTSSSPKKRFQTLIYYSRKVKIRFSLESIQDRRPSPIRELCCSCIAHSIPVIDSSTFRSQVPARYCIYRIIYPISIKGSKRPIWSKSSSDRAYSMQARPYIACSSFLYCSSNEFCSSILLYIGMRVKSHTNI